MCWLIVCAIALIIGIIAHVNYHDTTAYIAIVIAIFLLVSSLVGFLQDTLDYNTLVTKYNYCVESTADNDLMRQQVNSELIEMQQLKRSWKGFSFIPSDILDYEPLQ